ncbi:ABCC5 [Bugula neritina]|uniref:ABCC5 n=1 Tax=Bugula neritina TaxID=10212 RepID=A0A7J7ISE7_BUGNE|nr:ABCC5 [Bugula neritina]
MDILLVFCQLILTFFVSSVIPLIMANAGIRARAGVLSYVYKKILETHVQSYSAGELINLCANDGQRIFDACLSGVFSLGAFISLVGAAYSVYLLGLWGLLGFGVFFLSLPLKIYLSKKVFNNRSLAIPVTERRVTLTTEIINAIKLVKMYAWRSHIQRKLMVCGQHILDKKKREGILELSLFLQSILATLPWLIPQIATGVTFLAMTLSGNDLTLTQVC